LPSRLNTADKVLNTRGVMLKNHLGTIFLQWTTTMKMNFLDVATIIPPLRRIYVLISRTCIQNTPRADRDAWR
jgi:hypothetical protein